MTTQNHLLVIRIAGQPDLTHAEKEALFRMRIRRKYAATIVLANEENKKLLEFVRNLVSFGEIKPTTLKDLIEKRGQSKDSKKKIDSEKVMDQIIKKSPSEWDIKPFFRLHPPRGGIDAKKHAGVQKGVLGENKKMDELVGRML